MQLPSRPVGAAASISDPTVIKADNSFNNSVTEGTIFHALMAGIATLSLAYPICDPASTEPCSYEIVMNVVQFPRAQVTIENGYGQNSVKLHVGDVLRFTGPYDAVVSDGPVTLDTSGVASWAVEPIYLSRFVEGAVRAFFPGTATITASEWMLKIVVT